MVPITAAAGVLSLLLSSYTFQEDTHGGERADSQLPRGLPPDNVNQVGMYHCTCNTVTPRCTCQKYGSILIPGTTDSEDQQYIYSSADGVQNNQNYCIYGANLLTYGCTLVKVSRKRGYSRGLLQGYSRSSIEC